MISETVSREKPLSEPADYITGQINPHGKPCLAESIVMSITKMFFKASALWADAFYKSICPSVRPSVHF